MDNLKDKVDKAYGSLVESSWLTATDHVAIADKRTHDISRAAFNVGFIQAMNLVQNSGMFGRMAVEKLIIKAMRKQDDS